MGKVDYRHVIGKEKEDLNPVLDKLKRRGFAVRWDHLSGKYNARRRINNEEVHVIIMKKGSDWVATLHIDIIVCDIPNPLHRTSKDKNKTNHWGKLLFEEEGEAKKR
jgi:hypothetical protein